MKRIICLFPALAAILLMSSCEKGFFPAEAYEAPNSMYRMDENGEPQEEGDYFDEIVENEFIKVSEEPVSTFSIDADGAKAGYELSLTRLIVDAVTIPVIASGGAGRIEDFITLFETLPRVDAGLAASIFHFGEVTIPDLKAALKNNNIPVREV